MVIIGVDPHKRLHMASVVEPATNRRIAALQVEASLAGYRRLWKWAGGFGERRWAVEVGPFLVAVKGTGFTVDWDPANERFELRLHKGRVVVSGPMSGGDITLRAGQRLVVNLASEETVITGDTTEASSGGAVAPAAATPPSRASERPQAPRTSPPASGCTGRRGSRRR